MILDRGGQNRTGTEKNSVRFGFFWVSVWFFFSKKLNIEIQFGFFRFGSVSDQTLKNPNRTDNIIWSPLFYKF